MGPLDYVFAIIGLSILVIVHESGHYLAARAFKMRVLTYSIGFGPTIFKYQPKGSPTVFKVGAIPFLAYVQIAGMNPHEDVDPKDPELFPNKGLFARITTIAAGPVANYLTASLFVFVLGLVGWPVHWLGGLMPDDPRAHPPPHEPMTVERVDDGSAAQEAGIQGGDVIVAVNDHAVRHVTDLREQVTPNAGVPLEVKIDRGGREVTLTLTPKRHDDGRVMIGVAAVSPPAPPVTFSVGEAAKTAFTFPWQITVKQLEAIGDMIGRLSADGLGGPVKIAEVIGNSAQAGPLSFLASLVFLSVALGMFNLLPFPALDGGRLAFLAYEVVTRRRPNERFEAMVHTVGIVFLLGVIVLVTIRDIGEFGETPRSTGQTGSTTPTTMAPSKAPSSMAPAPEDPAMAPAPMTSVSAMLASPSP